MKSLPIELENISFVTREKVDGQSVKNRCGRDFIYYGLNYYLPQKFNNKAINPQTIEEKWLFGLALPSWLMWIQLQFLWLPSYLKENGLRLFINNKKVNSYFGFVSSILFSRLNFDNAMEKVKINIDEGRVVGIDIGLKHGGLLDHIIFVYGYDDEALYVCDTHKVPMLEYEKITTDDKYFMRLPKEVIKKRWTRFGRVWELKKV